MGDDSPKKLFDILLEDPEFLDKFQDERVIQEIAARLAPKLLQRLAPLIRDLTDEIFQDAASTMVRPIVQAAMYDLRRDVHRMVRAFGRMTEALELDRDDADWWKDLSPPDKSDRDRGEGGLY